MIFAYHGYPWLIHRLTYRRTNHDNFHVRGYKEEGTTTTPFDMLRDEPASTASTWPSTSSTGCPRLRPSGAHARERLRDQLTEHRAVRARARRGPARGPRLAVEPGRRPGGHRRQRAAARARGVMRVLVVNAGSSSLKLARAGRRRRASPRRTTVERVGRARRTSSRWPRSSTGCGPVDAVGHRVVHGGPRYTRAGAGRRRACVGLPRLDQPTWRRCTTRGRWPASASVRDAAARTCRPWPASTPRSTPRCRPRRRTYALPREWNERFGLRRYGFHGLSHAYAVRRGARARRPAGRGAADRLLPPRGRRLAGRGPGRRSRWTPRWASPRWPGW